MVVAVLAYLVAVLAMEINNEEQCDMGGTAGDDDDDDDDWRGNGSKLFGMGGGDGDDEEGQRRRVEEACQWERYTSLSHLENCLLSDPELCRAMLLMLGGEISVAEYNDNDDDDNDNDNDNDNYNDKDEDKINK